MSDEKEVSISTINQRLSIAFDAGNAVQFSIAAADAVVYAETLEQINERLHDRNKSQEARIKEIELELLSLRALRDAGDEEVDQHFANLRLVFGNTDSMAQSLAADSIYALRKIVAERKELRQQLREAQAEIERLQMAIGCATTIKGDMVMRADDPLGMMREVCSYVATLTAERDEARAEVDRLKAGKESGC